MDHTLNMLADSVQRLLADTVSHRGTIEAERSGIDQSAWDQLAGIGVVGEDASVMSAAELAVVVEAVSAAGALVPYADSEAVGRWLAGAADLDAGAGILAVVPIVEGEGKVKVVQGGVQLSIQATSIPWACRSEQVLFSFRLGEQCVVAVKDAREMQLQRSPSMADEPHRIVVSGSDLFDNADQVRISGQ